MYLLHQTTKQFLVPDGIWAVYLTLTKCIMCTDKFKKFQILSVSNTDSSTHSLHYHGNRLAAELMPRDRRLWNLDLPWALTAIRLMHVSRQAPHLTFPFSTSIVHSREQGLIVGESFAWRILCKECVFEEVWGSLCSITQYVLAILVLRAEWDGYGRGLRRMFCTSNHAQDDTSMLHWSELRIQDAVRSSIKKSTAHWSELPQVLKS